MSEADVERIVRLRMRQLTRRTMRSAPALKEVMRLYQEANRIKNKTRPQ